MPSSWGDSVSVPEGAALADSSPECTEGMVQGSEFDAPSGDLGGRDRNAGGNRRFRVSSAVPMVNQSAGLGPPWLLSFPDGASGVRSEAVG